MLIEAFAACRIRIRSPSTRRKVLVGESQLAAVVRGKRKRFDPDPNITSVGLQAQNQVDAVQSNLEVPLEVHDSSETRNCVVAAPYRFFLSCYFLSQSSLKQELGAGAGSRGLRLAACLGELHAMLRIFNGQLLVPLPQSSPATILLANSTMDDTAQICIAYGFPCLSPACGERLLCIKLVLKTCTRPTFHPFTSRMFVVIRPGSSRIYTGGA